MGGDKWDAIKIESSEREGEIGCFRIDIYIYIFIYTYVYSVYGGRGGQRRQRSKMVRSNREGKDLSLV